MYFTYLFSGVQSRYSLPSSFSSAFMLVKGEYWCRELVTAGEDLEIVLGRKAAVS